jgi:hypothetical protein
MNNIQFSLEKNKSLISNSTIIILAYGSAFFPRIIQSIGAPSLINFLHFITVPSAFFIAISSSKTKNKHQIIIFKELIIALLILLSVMVASALINHAGIINVVLDFMLLAEPFILLLAVFCISPSSETLNKIRHYVIVFASTNLLVAIAQKILITVGLLKISKFSVEDNIQGVFYLSGAGNYVSVSISICVALYFFNTFRNLSLFTRSIGLIGALYQLLVSDSKQILIAFFLGWVLLAIGKSKNPSKLILYFISFIVLVFGFLWCVENLNIQELSSFKIWLDRSELYGPDGEGTKLKVSGIYAVISHYKSSLNWLFGLGPGHTFSRLGGWVIRDYKSLFAPLGVTTNPVTDEMWNLVNGSWLAVSTTMFSPLFSWAGIWGDLGFLGLGSYLYIWYVVWCRLCQGDFSKLMILTIFVFAFIFTQIEEPGYMLTVTLLISLRWHEAEFVKRHRQYPQRISVLQ